MDDRAKGSPRCRCKSRERAAASTRFVQQRVMPHCHKLLISNQLRNERRFRTRSQRGSIVHARLSLRAASRGPRATIGSVGSRCRAEDRRRLVFDMLAAPSRRADESFKTECMTRLVITAKHRADGVRETHLASAASDGRQGSNGGLFASENFFPKSFQLAKKPRGTFWRPKQIGLPDLLQERFASLGREPTEEETRLLLGTQVPGGCTYSTWIRTTLPFWIRWTTS